MKNYAFYLLMMGLVLINSQALAVDYQLPDLQGETQSLAQYRGKWVIVNYWASWCGSCVKELPELAALHSKHKNSNIVVVGINYEDINIDRLKKIVSAYNIPYPVWRSKEVPVTPLGPVPALPTTYIIDPEGKVVAGQVGVMTQQNLEDYIARQKTLDEYAIRQGV
ncbi:MAG: TlpA family protein disulfide reductase [Gammaproteobacteria bacterium]|nr:TlpA family protein disulfide reductase [Gammaproteobacteria bacterium]